MEGKWYTTSGGSSIGAGAVVLGVLGALAIGTGTVTAAVADVTDMVEVALVCALAALLIVASAVVLVYRKSGRRPGQMPPTMQEHLDKVHAARDAERLAAASQRQIAAPVVQHFHYHAAPGQPEDVPVVLKAIREGDQR